MDFNTFIEKLPLKLNNQQLEAIQAVNGPVLLLAVPGSGKTTVLVARIGCMIYCHDINPSNILTLTYTVAATNDMRERFARFFGEDMGRRQEFRTLNSISAGIIKEYGRRIGQAPFELETDDKVLLAIIASLYLKIEDEYPTESDLSDIKTKITYIKNMMLADDEIKKLDEECNYHLMDIYKGYVKELRNRQRIDYDDQMIYAYKLLKSSPELLAYYQNMYPYICVDEAQDTSKIQHAIIALLASKTENLFMVGDEDQSIYGFRAAYPEALLSFSDNHKGAKVLLMEENFRSNANIVSAADKFIQHNTLRHPKRIKATRNAATNIKRIDLNSRGEQLSYLLKVAENATEETAVLYRDNESAIPLVDLCQRNNIQYRIRNAELSFFTNRVVVDIQNIMRFAFDFKNADLFEQIYYKISTYLTKPMALEACRISREFNISVFSAINGYIELKPHTRKSIKALETHFTNMRSEAPARAIARIVSFMGYGDYLDRVGLSTTKIVTMKSIAAHESTINGFINRMEELRDIIQNHENNKDCPFVMSTIHASKGLEYDNVYLLDVIDGIFPESVPKDYKHANRETIGIYEEERRLFYVGITRAKNNLFLFKTNEPSTFVREIVPNEQAKEHNSRPVKTSTTFNKRVLNTNHYQESKNIDKEAKFQAFMEHIAIGTVIHHISYGEGIITGINGTNIEVSFAGNVKTMDLKILFKNRLITL